MKDRHLAKRTDLERSVLQSTARTSPDLRQTVARGHDVPEPLRALVDKIHQHAYKVTDEEIEALKSRYSDDELFEIIVAAALGASLERLSAGLRAVSGR